MPRIKKKKEIGYYIQDFIDYCTYKDLSVKTIIGCTMEVLIMMLHGICRLLLILVMLTLSGV